MSDNFGLKIGVERKNDKRTQNWAVQLNYAKAHLNNMARVVAQKRKSD